MKRRIALVIAAGAVSLLAGTMPARAQGSVIVSGPGSYLTTYTQPVTVVPVGGELTYANADAQRHDVLAREAKSPYQCPSEPGVCSADVPFWCLPPNPDAAWDTDPNGNPLPYAPGQCPMIWSRLIGLGSTTPVYGTQYMTAGEAYEFYCSLHTRMVGFIVAAPAA